MKVNHDLNRIMKHAPRGHSIREGRIMTTITQEARAIHIAPKYFYYVPKTRAELLRFLGSEFKTFNKNRLYAIYHARRRKEKLI